MSSGRPFDEGSPLELTSNGVPAFTLEDMREYLQSTPSCALGPTVTGQPPTIETVEFVRCRELTDRLHLYFGLADDALVCYVVLRGPFYPAGVSYAAGSQHVAGVCNRAQEIYDAQTGRLLLIGAGPPRP